MWTLGFTAALLYFLFGIGEALARGQSPILFDVGASVLLLALMAWAWVRGVKGYQVDSEHLTIMRNGPGRMLISHDKIRSVTFKPDIGSYFNSRLLGLGGLFGWAGPAKVRNPTDVKSLDAEVYGTHPQKSVVLDLDDGRALIVTPDDPQSLVAALREASPIQMQSAPTTQRRAKRGRKR